MPLDELARDVDVLVVDDEPTVRELLREYFADLGFRVTAAEDGRGAIALLQTASARFGLVVTDLNLPGADGFAVLHAARQRNPHCFVVIITGYASLDSAIRAVRVGACDYLTKPFSLAQLDGILMRIRERRAQQVGQPAPPAGPAAIPVPQASAVHPQTAQASTACTETPPVGVETLPAAVPADPPVASPAPAPTYPGLASYNIAQRLGLLEAAFGRVEALLREKR